MNCSNRCGLWVGLILTGLFFLPNLSFAAIVISNPGDTLTIQVCENLERFVNFELIPGSDCESVTVTVNEDRELITPGGLIYRSVCTPAPSGAPEGLVMAPAACNYIQSGRQADNDNESATPAEGLVPCGGTGQEPCQSCDVVKLTNNVIAWLVIILGTIAALIIIYAGVKLVTSGGNVHAMEEAKSMMINIIIGYVIVLAGWLVIDYGMKALVNEATFGVWNEVQCTQQPVATSTAQTVINYGGRLTASGANNSSFSSGDVTMTVAGIRASGDVRSMAEAAARAAGITDPIQIRTYVALISQESSMCRNRRGPDTGSGRGRAYGCGQMLLGTARQLDPNVTAERLETDNAYNLSLSARFYAGQLNQYNGNMRLTLASYNGGDGANGNSVDCPGLRKWECTINGDGYAQTRNYVSNILQVAGGL